MVLAPMIALMIAILETSLAFFAQQVLDTTAEKSVRALMTGQAQRANTTQAQFKTAVCNTLPTFLKCANVMVDVRTATTFSDASTSPSLTFNGSGNITNSWQFAPGGPGAINVVTIMYIWQTQASPLGFDLATMSRGRRLLVSTSVFKTEPYTS
jgi:Flp pilus assembly protein TadG